MESFPVTQKQTHTPLNTHRSIQSNPITGIPPALSPKAGLLFTGLTALVAAAVTTLAFATDHDPSLKQFQQSKTVTSQQDLSPSAITQSTHSSQGNDDEPSTSDGAAEPHPEARHSVQGTITIGDEILPATEGITSRTFVDDQGNSHSVTVTIDNQSSGGDSSSTNTDIVVNSDTWSNTDNTTRGSPRR